MAAADPAAHPPARAAAPRRRLWCELAWLGGERAEAGVLLELDGDRLAAVTPGAEPPEDAERLAGLTLPGLANAHSHAFQRALRGRTQAGTGTFWTWREQMYELAERLDPDSCFAISRAAFGEMAMAGITCVGEFHYVHHAPGGAPYDDPNAMGRAVLAAAEEAGIRITLLDACYLHGGIDRFRDTDAVAWAARVDALHESPGVRVGAAIHSVRAVDPESARAVAEWADGRPLHAHVSEQPAENEQALAEHGRSPAALLDEAGALSELFTAVHATHLTVEDVALLGGARATCCLCPTTERDLADGIGPAGLLRDAGARLAVGSDSQAVIDLFEEARAVAEWADGRPLHAHVSEQPAENDQALAEHGRTPAALLDEAGALSELFTAVHATHLTVEDVALLGGARATCCLCPTTERDLADGIGPAGLLRDAGARLAVGSDSQAFIDLFEEARAVELDERLASNVRGRHTAADLLRAATAGGCAALGWPEAGRLGQGTLADLATVSLDSVRLAGTRPEHAVEAAVFAAAPGDVRHVMAGGRWIVRDGAHVDLDVAAELAAAL